MNFLEISAKSYDKVEKAFNTLTENILKKISKGEISETTVGIKIGDDIRIDPLADQPKKKCCW